MVIASSKKELLPELCDTDVWGLNCMELIASKPLLYVLWFSPGSMALFWEVFSADQAWLELSTKNRFA